GCAATPRTATPAGSWAAPTRRSAAMRTPSRSSRRSSPGSPPTFPPCCSSGWPRRRAATSTRPPTGSAGPAPRTPPAPSPASTWARCCTTAGSTSRRSTRCATRSPGTPSTPRRTTLQAMAEVHLLRRELTPALELYDALVREHADSPKLWNERGVCLHQAGRRAEAIASYERAVDVDGGYQLAWNNLGVVRAGEAGEAALAAFRRALDGGRPLLAARLNLGLL